MAKVEGGDLAIMSPGFRHLQRQQLGLDFIQTTSLIV